jgi:uncharacterized protein
MTLRPWRRWAIAVALMAATAAGGMRLLGPAPPSRITLATGQPGGTYDAFGAQYRQRLERIGLHTTTVPGPGSVDNLTRLLGGDVDVAFVQSGTAGLVPDPGSRLRGIAAIYFEPVWVFHRLGPGIDSIGGFAGRRVSVGPAASGTEAVATMLLREHGIDSTTADLRRLSNAEAQAQLERGALDAAFIVTSFRNPLVLSLLAAPAVQLLEFRREAAYARKFPALTPLRLPEGLLDLRRNLPSHDTMLLSPTALLACRDDLHPRVVEQVLKAAKAIHVSGSLMDPPLRFPTLEGVDLQVHDAALVYLTQGESFLSRTLPYSLLRWTGLLRLLILSAIVYIPLVRVLPAVAGWRVERRLRQMYGVLRQAERRVARAETPSELRAALAALDGVCRDAEALGDRVPAARQRDVYQWRMHVAFVRANASARLASLEQKALEAA